MQAQLLQDEASQLSALRTARVLGRTEPRIFTPPLRELTPETSYGFGVIEFARYVLRMPLDPWEEWTVVHAGELLPDGRPRFRVVLILVARQNGKTTLLKVLSLYWLFVEEWPQLLGLSTDRTYAKKTLTKVAEQAQSVPELRELLPAKKNRGLNVGVGDEKMTTAAGCEYLIAAINRRAGRSLSIDRLIIDEIREHRSWDAWNACKNAMNARPYAQAFCISNQGDDEGVVLDSLREDALNAITAGDTGHRTGLIEYSAPEGADLLDPNALAAANPNLGRRLLIEDLLDELIRAKRKGGKEEAQARTEILCQRVHALDGAVNPRRWAAGYVPGDLSNMRSRIALCLDVSLDQLHATLAGAAVMEDGRVRVEVLSVWQGTENMKELARQVREIVRKVRPQAFGWLPIGPTATYAANLAVRRGRIDWPPQGVTVEEIRGEVSAVCMGFAAEVDAERIVHNDDPLLNVHVTAAAKLWSGDTWKFSRRGEGHCDGAYAAAGAVHLARTLPKPVGKPRIIMVGEA